MAEVLLRPSVLYGPAARAAADTGVVRGMAHITGGGIPGNLIRPLPEGRRAAVDRSAWEIPNVFTQIQRMGGMSDDAMAETFNLGIGFCIVTDPDAVDELLETVTKHGHQATVIGRVIEGERGVDLI